MPSQHPLLEAALPILFTTLDGGEYLSGSSYIPVFVQARSVPRFRLTMPNARCQRHGKEYSREVVQAGGSNFHRQSDGLEQPHCTNCGYRRICLHTNAPTEIAICNLDICRGLFPITGARIGCGRIPRGVNHVACSLVYVERRTVARCAGLEPMEHESGTVSHGHLTPLDVQESCSWAFKV